MATIVNINLEDGTTLRWSYTLSKIKSILDKEREIRPVKSLPLLPWAILQTFSDIEKGGYSNVEKIVIKTGFTYE